MSAQPVVPPDVTPLRLLDEDRRRRAGVARPAYAGLHPGRKPPWLKTTLRQGDNFRDLKRLVGDLQLHTVCEQARCPNIYECWELREATFLIGGEDCTRRCGFCQIRTGKPKGYDRDEPRRVAEAVAHLRLRFAVVTMVARDDLADGGAWLVAETVRRIRARVPGCGIEVLPSDFGYAHDPVRGLGALDQVVEAGPDVFAFNVETCRRLFPVVRPAFTYDGSLGFLAEARRRLPATTAVKSNIIVGMGETDDEVVEVMRDLRAAGVSLLTIGQYLQPSAQHLHLDRYVTPDRFAEFRRIGEENLGFAHVESGPMVRSSYHAGTQAVDAGAWAPASNQPPLRRPCA
ncbi:MAG TPA: lipoyl synthase [Nitriliruptorales bacterium]|nr:lipoyl synthase [Nitriliruptorales bacterium]